MLAGVRAVSFQCGARVNRMLSIQSFWCDAALFGWRDAIQAKLVCLFDTEFSILGNE